jgi:hypothetical protein
MMAIAATMLVASNIYDASSPKFKGKSAAEWVSLYAPFHGTPDAEVVRAFGTDIVSLLGRYYGWNFSGHRSLFPLRYRMYRYDRVVVAGKWCAVGIREIPSFLEALLLSMSPEQLSLLLVQARVSPGELRRVLIKIETTSEAELARVNARILRRQIKRGNLPGS